MKFSIKDLFTKLDQIRRKQRIWSDLLKKSLMENFIFCAVKSVSNIIVWRLHLETITYFVWPERLTILNMVLVCSIFLINQVLNFVTNPRWIFVITENCFVWNKVRKDIFNCFSKYIDLFVDNFFCKGSFSRIIIDCSLQKQSAGGVLQKRCSQQFHKIPGKHLGQSLFFKKETVTQVFSC